MSIPDAHAFAAKFFYMPLQFSDGYTNKICTNQEQNLPEQEIESLLKFFSFLVIMFSLEWKSLMNPSRNEVKTMPDAMSVRTGKEKDIDTLVKFNIAMAWETEQKQLSPSIVTQGVQMLLKNPHYGFYIVAEIADEVVGCCMVTYEWSDWRCGLFWWIQSVYVDSGFRRRGVFKRLYEFLKEKASHESNVCGFRLYVEHSNLAGQSTYAGVGMEEVSYKFYEESFES